MSSKIDLRRLHKLDLSVRVERVCEWYGIKTVHSALKFAKENKGKYVPYNGTRVVIGNRFEQELLEVTNNRTI